MKEEAKSVTGIESVEDTVDEVFGAEYEHKPVPYEARRSTFSVTTVWIGFPMIITGAMTGSILVAGMGFARAVVAMVVGNLLMFGYVGALGLLGTKRGMNYPLLASIVFGRKGYVFSSALLSTLLLGWYAVQTGITGNLVASAYHLNYVLMTAVAGILYIGVTLVGVRGLHWIGIVSVPLFVILGVWVAADAAVHAGWGHVVAYNGATGVSSMSMGVGLTVVLTLFVDAGTVAADFNRWAKDTRSSLLATFSAFPFANLVAMLVGGVMTAALAKSNPQPFATDNMFGYMNDVGSVWLSILAFIFLYCNLGSVCSHCLYNSAIGWARIFGSHMRLLALLLGGLGILIAAGNVWAYFIQWLSLLGVLVPPIGAIILVDQYIGRRNSEIDADWRPTAFVAWAAGSAVALFVNFRAPDWSTALSAFVVAILVYGALSLVFAENIETA